MAMPGRSVRLTTELAKPNSSEPVANAPEALDSQAPVPGSPTKDDPPPLRSVHTCNFSAILQELGISVLATTYQAGNRGNSSGAWLYYHRICDGRRTLSLIAGVLRGEGLNTHFRTFGKPMGLAVDGDRLAIGTTVESWEYHCAPAVTCPSIGRGIN